MISKSTINHRTSNFPGTVYGVTTNGVDRAKQSQFPTRRQRTIAQNKPNLPGLSTRRGQPAGRTHLNSNRPSWPRKHWSRSGRLDVVVGDHADRSAFPAQKQGPANLDAIALDFPPSCRSGGPGFRPPRGGIVSRAQTQRRREMKKTM